MSELIMVMPMTGCCSEQFTWADNKIGDEGACYLAEALKTNKALKSLDLESYFTKTA